MSRIKLTLPEKFIYSTDITIRISDINYGGHLGNDAVLSIVHDARVRFLNSLEYSESNIENVGIIMNDAAIVYSSQAFYGDVLTVKIALNDLSKIGFDMFYLLLNKTTNKEVARLKTGIVFYNYRLKKIVEIPQPFIQKIGF